MNNTTSRSIGLLRIFLFLLVFVLGCYPAPKVPIDTLRYDAPTVDHRLLFVYLPGNGDPLTAFEKNGLVQALRTRNLQADVIAVNAHLGYYMNGSIFIRLKQDVIDPAKARGYRQIWFVGNSLGGYGSLSYTLQYPHDITGVILLGPFLGEKKTIREISDAGGLQRWEPGDIPRKSKEDWEKYLWKWIKDADQHQCFRDKTGNGEVRDNCPGWIYLGYGKHDRFSYGQSFMAQYLPSGQVFEIDGGHDWQTWTKLWNLILDRIVIFQ
jgi:pimeloyl-ACP methyl ester carboxylesterase